MTQEMSLYTARTLDETMTLGKVLAQSGYFADSREAAQAVVKILAGQELGFGPIASMTGVNIIKGKVTLSANLIASAIKRSGRYNYRVVTMTDEACRVDFYEAGERIGTSEFTMQNAKDAGLTTGDNWRKFPRNMLFARAISNGAKWYCPDLSGGPIYTPDELGATVDGETGEVIDMQPARTVTVERPTAAAQPDTSNGNGAKRDDESGLPFRNTPKDAVDWAMQHAPQVWPVDEHGYIVRLVVERSFANCRKASNLSGDALGHEWISKVNGKIADRAKAAIITDAELDGTDMAPAVAGDDEPQF